jgi:PKD repeat protein
MLASFDGASWFELTSGAVENLNSVLALAEGFAVVGDGGRLVTTADGSVWSAEIVPPEADLLDGVELDGGLVLFGTNGLIVREVGTDTGAPVEAAFSWRPSSPAPGEVVRFTSRSTGGPTATDWLFSDGGTASGEVVDHVFAEIGVFEVELSVTGPGGGDTHRAVVTVGERCSAYEAPVMQPVAVDPVDRSATFSWKHPDDPLLFETDFSSSPLFPPSDLPQPDYTPESSETVANRWPDVRTTYLRVRAGRRCPGGWVLSPWSDSAFFEHRARARADGAIQSLVPAAAHTPGVGDTFWTSDLVIFNPGPRAASVAVKLMGETVGSTSRALRAGETLVMDDVVADLVSGEVVGSLLVGGDAPLVATSRTATASGSGSVGQLIPASPLPRPFGSSARIIGLARTDGFRSNLGFASGWSESSEILTRFFKSPDGALLGERNDTLLPWGHLQLNDVLGELGVGDDLEGVHAEVIVPGLDAEVVVYASIVDNGTGDPTLRERAMPPISGTMLIPSVARLEGVAGSLWRSELVLANRADEPSVCSMSWLRRGVDNSEPQVAVRQLDAAASLVIGDVLSELYGADGAGALTVACTPNSVAATSRTYAVGHDGTYGQSVAAFDLEDALEAGERGVLPGISESSEPSSGTRSNIGLVSLCAEPMTVDEVFLEPDGTELGRRIVELERFEVVQHNRPLASLGGNDGGGRTAVVSTTTPECRFAAWASVVDNRTHDPVFVSATAMPPVVDPPVVGTVLDNREAAVLAGLPQSVSSGVLPLGRYRLTVEGSGALGHVRRALQMLCMWREASGAQQAGVLSVGEVAYELTGGSEIHCIVPDLEDCGDNTGWARVRLEGSSMSMALDVDPAVNCVEVDGLAGARAVDVSGMSSWLSPDVTGDLGAAIDEPVALLVSGQGGFDAREQISRVVRHGDDLLFIEAPAYAVVIDLDDASDNRGQFVFRPF